ncbi:GNAT family N-acetyltransferase [Pseudomonas huanghezhanensis]|uniref:GNAT family N-acetyltransferase n=1 Tax=Pseudomonas huanghezhanensis TaxID=3002903 RepID=UPI002285526E|nr:GNAT family N-acetyltransferase [Pseudomonas sp. BSw22131]
MIEYKPAVIADIPRLWALRTRAVRLTCATHYSSEQIDVWSESAVPQSYTQLVVAQCAVLAEEDDQLLGYAILDRQNGEVVAIFVEPHQHGRGIGKQLMRRLEAMAVIEHFTRLHLFSSLNAADFYRAMGFIALREEAYGHPSGISLRSLYMEKTLAGQAR